jgi:hypothetical protein
MIVIFRKVFFALASSALAITTLACAGIERPNTKEAPPMITDLSRIDHVILGIGDLDQGTAELARLTGVRAAFGGAHPGRGTQNALISLGAPHYLEILAPNPAEAGNPDAAELRALTALTPVGWAVRSDELEALHRSLGAKVDEIRPGGRNLPDGSRLDWKTLSFAASSSPLLPFFIEWGRGGAHPSTTSPPGCQLTGFALEDPAPDAVREALLAAGLQVEVRAGKASRIRISLTCAKGTVEL